MKDKGYRLVVQIVPIDEDTARALIKLLLPDGPKPPEESEPPEPQSLSRSR
jgi:hypothetical protein